MLMGLEINKNKFLRLIVFFKVKNKQTQTSLQGSN